MLEQSVSAIWNPLISFVGASPVKTSAAPASGQESKASEAGCGLSSTESFASYDPDTCSWKTSQLCLFGGWIEFSETWPMAGTMRNGIVFRQQPLVPRISDIGFSFLPTATASMGEVYNEQTTNHDTIRKFREAGIIPKRWPIPKSSPSGPDFARASRPGTGSDDLATAVARFPTPTSTDAIKGGNVSPRRGAMGLSETLGGQLNPTWIEWLMGFPEGWTDLEGSPTPSSRKSPNGSGDES
ncbi:hypothetical protein LCGC14_0322900 [marine sediment metagenome]|uniref:Uncharacterized protein n=1 Tax=marine sediment metagenome TaxID=412755 RepID=A0A0F9W5W3_9ZZZZ